LSVVGCLLSVEKKGRVQSLDGGIFNLRLSLFSRLDSWLLTLDSFFQPRMHECFIVSYRLTDLTTEETECGTEFFGWT
jgi:hypothetical protein